MPDNYGRMTESEAPESLKKLLYGRTCYVCGAPLRDGEETVCWMVHRKDRPVFAALPPEVSE